MEFIHWISDGDGSSVGKGNGLPQIREQQCLIISWSHFLLLKQMSAIDERFADDLIIGKEKKNLSMFLYRSN